MTKSSLAGRGHAADHRVEDIPTPLREILLAYRMLRTRGIKAMWAHASTIALSRAHRLLIDRHLEDRLPTEAVDLRTAADGEIAAAVAHAPVPAKSMHWAIAGSQIDVRDFHFVDVGSGRGCAVVRAATYPFKSVTGIEFARPYHEDALANVAWADAVGLLAAGSVDLRYESALHTKLPAGPCLLFLFAPFEDVIMRPFLDLVSASMREHPRPILAIYVNPVASRAFERRDIQEISLAPRERALIRLFSPYAVKAYAWKG
jgi:hypothetical protein